MNIKNLKAIAALCRTIPEAKFNMRYFRVGQRTAECNTIGCVIGHATRLETGQLPRDSQGDILFARWSEDFTGLSLYSQEWHWCFGGSWAEYDNTPLGAAKRIEWLLDGEEAPDMRNGATHQMVAMYS